MMILWVWVVIDLVDVLDVELVCIDFIVLLGEMELLVQWVLVKMESVGIVVDLFMLIEL